MYDSVWGGHNKHASNLHDMKFECFGICMGTYFSIQQGSYNVRKSQIQGLFKDIQGHVSEN